MDLPDCNGTTTDQRFANLGAPRRIWAISAIHGEMERLYALHDAILERLQAGDRILYTGNLTGFGQKSRETIDEILAFRRIALSQPGVQASDFVFLRGIQEDMWQKLFQLPFEHAPEQILTAMLNNGLRETLLSYGIDEHEGMRCCKEGVLALTRWTMKIRAALRANPAHEVFLTQHKRAAFAKDAGWNPVLFVNAGLNPHKDLEDQGEDLWRNDHGFRSMTAPYAPYTKVIRGYDPAHQGLYLNCVIASIDGGAGFGGNLICAQIDKSGQIQELLQA